MNQSPIKDVSREESLTSFWVEFRSPTGKRYETVSFGSEVCFQLDRFLGVGSSQGRVATVYGTEAADTLKNEYDTIYNQVVKDFHNPDIYKTFILHGNGAYDGTAYVQFCIARTIEKMMK